MAQIDNAHQAPLGPPSATLTFGVEEEETTHLNESSLPPVDGGFRAWTFLLAAVIIGAVVWGLPFSFGVFLEAYLKDPKYTTSGIMYCSGPFINMFITRYPFHRSYTVKLSVLLFLQGVLYAIGGAFLYYPCLSYMSEWFVRRRGLANGTISAGTASGGLVLPLFLPSLISSQGSQKALRYLSIGLIALLVPILPFVKGRLPELRSSRVRAPARMMFGEKAWLTNSTFWVILVANTLQGFGYFVPVLWLPTFATALDINATNASIALAMLNGGSIAGRLFLGYLCDKFNPWALSLSTLVFTSISTIVLWGVLSYSFAGLVAFGVAYGLLAGGYTSLWTGFFDGVGIKSEYLYQIVVSDSLNPSPGIDDNPIHSTIILGYLMFSRGIGNILSTPISTALSSSNSSLPAQNTDVHLGFAVDNGKYEKVIVYVGACFAGAAAISLMGWLGEKKRVRESTQ
ncbi:hypothetical protein VNI00_006659 [Paramarasmius palmivorus]|uniref:MFS general substrate transporter n=1 Tax=Paramarasmius palmivorus TaxID=297713 RepID=A0AAW0D8L4_9AGAR